MKLNILIYLLLLSTCSLCAQDKFHIENFTLLKHAELNGEYGSSRGLLAQFLLVDTLVSGEEVNFELTLRSNAFEVFSLRQSYTLDQADSLVQFQIPYRAIELEEGLHQVLLILKFEGKHIPIYTQKFRHRQPKVFDLFLDLKEATIEPDSNYNPIGINQQVPDPVWVVEQHNQRKQGLVDRNSFQPLPKEMTMTMSKYDTIRLCVYDADPVVDEHYLGCYTIPANEQNIDKKIEEKLNERVSHIAFHLLKKERQKVASTFQVTDNHIHRGIKGLKIDFTYGLPYYYRRKSIDIALRDNENQAIQQLIKLTNERTQEANRIVGNYTYFIPYHYLQSTKYIDLQLLANQKTIRQHIADSLQIPKTIEQASITQKTSYKYKDISGILYRLDYQLPELKKGVQLSLQFPTLKEQTLAKMKYWSANTPSVIYDGTEQKIPPMQQQTIFVFLPYYVAPKQIALQPKLILKNIGVPAIEVATFKSKPYQRPKELSDISIKSVVTKDHVYTGIAGQLYRFETTIPVYYHSKGHFYLEILEDGQAMKENFFINGNAYGKKKIAIHRQEKIEVFIPYRAMKGGKKYAVSLQAKSDGYPISEKRQENYDNALFSLGKSELYIQKVNAPDWQGVICNYGVRNFKNINRTYMHLGYDIVASDTLPKNSKPKYPKAHTLVLHPDDELVLWVKNKGDRDANAQIIRTSIAQIRAKENELQLKNEGALKQFILKLVDK